MSAPQGFATDLHPRLAADCHPLGRTALCQLLLYRNDALPWFILVPDVRAAELHELACAERAALTREADALARYAREALACEKVNVAAIGNLVPQLHVHVVGRRRDDPCWPGVVWGRLAPDRPYGERAILRLREDLRSAMGLVPEAAGAPPEPPCP